MKIPKTLKIGGHKIKVNLGKSSPHEDAVGKWDVDSNTIWIDADLPQSQKEVTLIHEILHAVNNTFSDNPIAHSLVESISEQLYQVLSDNKLLR
jgi:hypothetical protein